MYLQICIYLCRAIILHPVVLEPLREDNLRQSTTRPQPLEDNSLKTLVQVAAAEHSLPISTDTLQHRSNGGYLRGTGGAVLQAEATGGRKESSGRLQGGERIGQQQGAIYIYIYYVCIFTYKKYIHCIYSKYTYIYIRYIYIYTKPESEVERRGATHHCSARRMLTYADPCLRMLTYADVCRREGAITRTLQRPTYADVC